MRATATVLSFDRRKGYGFLLPDDLTADVFVHRNDLPPGRRYLNPNDRVDYEIGQRNGRPVAVNVTVVADAAVRR